MEAFKKFRRKQIAELREVTEDEISRVVSMDGISISDVDKDAGSPKKGDMIARNPKNHRDQWLVAKEYFEENFFEIN